MNSNYRGYIQANQSVMEENEESEDDRPREDVDLESGRSTIFHNSHNVTRSPHAQGKRRAGWDPGASEMNAFHPNIHQEDKIHEHESSDDEVPQSFKVEATRPPASPKFTDQPRVSEPKRNHALYSTDGRKLPPVSPKAYDKSPPPLNVPPRPSETDEETSSRNRYGNTQSQGSTSSFHQSKPAMRGLDDYEKALWNWVNVYNLDAFLQEVYAYYEGKGIYSIALSRGLNLL